ncbi:hypothetical protein V6319_14760, partial [Acinetobacter baumannii]
MQKHDAFAALRYRDFSIVTINQFCLTLAILIQEIIVAYSLYSQTTLLFIQDSKKTRNNSSTESIN